MLLSSSFSSLCDWVGLADAQSESLTVFQDGTTVLHYLLVDVQHSSHLAIAIQPDKVPFAVGMEERSRQP